MPLIAWCTLILFVDVAHVYSTLYTTYFDKLRFIKHKILFTSTPILCYAIGVLLYFLGSMVFWRCLAYLAVFHFIRQQYGFMRLYSKTETNYNYSKTIDTIAIYGATLYPLFFWHCTPNRNFNWFVKNDFIITNSIYLRNIPGYLYVAIVSIYMLKEIYQYCKTRNFNLPKNVLLIGTMVSWYFGIVYFNGDMAFTLLNVISHGIPYMALIWLGIIKQAKHKHNTTKIKFFFSKYRYGFFIFLGSLVLLAYLEEGLWDGFIWKEHQSIFRIFNELPLIDNNLILMFLVPLLSLPQSTHYVLDGFIWRRKYA